MSTGPKNTGPLADDDLAVFFDAGRADTAAAPPALLKRVQADAEDEARKRALYAGALRQDTALQPRRAGLFGQLLETIGGWPSLAAFASVAVLGVGIGVAQPDTVAELAFGWTADATEYDYVELLPGLDALGTEG